jgi:hypothetical protein
MLKNAKQLHYSRSGKIAGIGINYKRIARSGKKYEMLCHVVAAWFGLTK